MNIWLILCSVSPSVQCKLALQSVCNESVINVPVACSAAGHAVCSVDLVSTPGLVVQVQVTRLVEQRMLQQPSRAAAYRQYQQTTAMWFPGTFCFSLSSRHPQNT